MHTYMSLDWVRKPENPEETPAALGELQAQGSTGNQTPSHGCVRRTC